MGAFQNCSGLQILAGDVGCILANWLWGNVVVPFSEWKSLCLHQFSKLANRLCYKHDWARYLTGIVQKIDAKDKILRYLPRVEQAREEVFAFICIATGK
jgi:hypothetical protein